MKKTKGRKSRDTVPLNKTDASHILSVKALLGLKGPTRIFKKNSRSHFDHRTSLHTKTKNCEIF
jgi:hypothetical protein